MVELLLLLIAIALAPLWLPVVWIIFSTVFVLACIAGLALLTYAKPEVGVPIICVVLAIYAGTGKTREEVRRNG